mmetsp:Transcript_23962/g.74274  ORF Transcript_23962/g.74274 Transcript_23962/m.74274 type:complete len:246 (-) Transcript_23962:345-1082(-)
MPHGRVCHPGPRLPVRAARVDGGGGRRRPGLPGGVLREDDGDGHGRHRHDPRGHDPDVPARLLHGHGQGPGGPAGPGRGLPGHVHPPQVHRRCQEGNPDGPQDRGGDQQDLRLPGHEGQRQRAHAGGHPGPPGLGQRTQRGGRQGAPVLPRALAHGLLRQPGARRLHPGGQPHVHRGGPAGQPGELRRRLRGHPAPRALRQRPARPDAHLRGLHDAGAGGAAERDGHGDAGPHGEDEQLGKGGQA